MKFKLTTARYSYTEDRLQPYIDVGFEFEKKTGEYFEGKYVIVDSREVFININSLKDLTKLIEVFGNLVIDSEEITIYDGYLE